MHASMGDSGWACLWFYYHEEHQLPHVAVRGEHRATVRLEDGAIPGGLPPARSPGRL
jgi:hypothetical protein